MTAAPAPDRTRRASWPRQGGLLLASTAGLLAGHALLAPGFYDSHDGLLNVHRLFELEKCLADGQIPCRWVPDMGFGFGYPLFVFYPPLPTWIAEIFRWLGASILDAVKWSFVLSLVVGGGAMYALAAAAFGPRAGFLSAVLYTWAPYRAIDVYVRGALGESWGIALLPIVFHTAYRTLTARSPWRWGLACALAWCALLLTHDLVVLMAAPAYAAWCLLWVLSGGRGREPRRAWAAFAVAHLLAVGLAAHYVVPSLLEQRYAHTDTLVSLYSWARYENNFLDFSQLLLGTAPWGHGPFRSAGGMSLFVGGLQWGLASLVLGCIAIGWLVRRAIDDTAKAALLLALAGWAAATMTVGISRPVWDHVPPLAFLQFPWRFLAVATLGFSFAAGWAVTGRDGPVALLSGREAEADPRWQRSASLLAALLSLAAIALAWSWFAPRAMHVVADHVLANEREIARARHGLFDFMPKGVDLERFPARLPPGARAPAMSLDGNAVIRNAVRRSDRVAFDAVVEGPTPGLVRIDVFAFPGWTARIDDRITPLAAADDPLARIHVTVPPGRHRVRITFEDTPVRAWSDRLSLLACAGALVWAVLALRGGERSER